MKPTQILFFAAMSGIVYASDPCDCSPACSCGHAGQVSAPISVMGDHLHPQGEWMISLRSMFMDMDGMYDGSNSVSPASVHAANYLVSPTRMTMQMQMLGVMYAPSDKLTLMAMLPYLQNSMEHVIDPSAAMLLMANGGAGTFETSSSGIGDLKLSALLRLKTQGGHHLHGGFGISLPTGSISQRDIVPGPGGRLSRQLPAAMQPGSGSFDLLPSLTYRYHTDDWVFGAQARGVIRTAKNHHDYHLGHRAEIDAWISACPCSWLSLNAGFGFRWEDQLRGTQADVAQTPPMPPGSRTVPTAWAENYGGMQFDAVLGLGIPFAEGHRLGLDLRVPLWQEVNGRRLGQDFTATVGWLSSF